MSIIIEIIQWKRAISRRMKLSTVKSLRNIFPALGQFQCPTFGIYVKRHILVFLLLALKPGLPWRTRCFSHSMLTWLSLFLPKDIICLNFFYVLRWAGNRQNEGEVSWGFKSCNHPCFQISSWRFKIRIFWCTNAVMWRKADRYILSLRDREAFYAS